MPRYKVLEPGFHDGRMYKPNHAKSGRRVVHTDKPLKPVPTWLKAMKEETAAEKKSRIAKQKKTAKADADKAAEDKSDIDAVTFTDQSPGSSVETLG